MNMNSININWRAAAVVSLVLFVVLFGLLSSVSAQTITPEPPTLPDVGPIIDDTTTNLNTFLVSAEMVIAILVWGVTQAVKYFTKSDDIDSGNIYLGVLFAFSGIYFVGNLAGYLEQINSGIAFLTVMADPLWQIIVALVGSGLIYGTGRLTGNVVMAGRQGEERRVFESPEPLNLVTGRTQNITVYPSMTTADEIAEDVLKQVTLAIAKG
jgi:hypothetical protein